MGGGCQRRPIVVVFGSKAVRQMHVFNIHLEAERGVHMIYHAGTDAVAKVAHTPERYLATGFHQRFLPIYECLPMVVEAVAEHTAESGAAIAVVSKKHIAEITAHSQREFAAQRHGIHH